MKPLIIGQAPARGNEGLPPFSGTSGARLAKLSGVGGVGEDLRGHFELVNLIPYYPGKQGRKGDYFPLAEARVRAMALLEIQRQQPSRDILLMGRKVRRAMGLANSTPYLVWEDLWESATGLHRVVLFPHPSGINQFWNDHDNRVAARDLIRGVLADARA